MRLAAMLRAGTNTQPFALGGVVLLSFLTILASAQPAASAPEDEPAKTDALQTTNNSGSPLDLPTTLRLAGARNLDIQIARAGLKEAEANRQSAIEQFFPWISPGIGYHRRDGVAQAVPSGVISDAHFQSYSPGASLNAQLVLGDAIYNSLASK
ncbi:MAG: hypothetical protein ACREIC_07970, partial [Limisphaerales bacterium]